MFIKISILVLVLLATLTLTRRFGQESRPGTEASSTSSASAAPCQPDIVSSYVRKLSSRRSEGSQAAISLLNIAKQSAECRADIVSAVIRALNNADVEKDDSAFNVWATGSAILGRLKAVEAVDLLVAHLDLNDGLFSASMVHEPVVLAMVKMGDVAVPKLALALKHSPKKRIRLAAAYCLGDIGGSDALDAMKSALNTETEECVRRFITLTLPSPGISANANRPITAADGELLRQRLLAYTCSN